VVSRSKRLFGVANAAPPCWGHLTVATYQSPIWSNRLSSCSCFRMYSRTTSSSRPTVDTKNPRAQKCWPTKFRFRSPYTRARWIALLPLMYPITCDTAYLGGIAIIMCTWSGSRCPSSIRLSFCSASRRKISPKYRHNPAYSALRRHLGMNTTWYLHSHFVWFRLSYSSIADLLFVCFSGSRSGVSAMDSSKCQTLTATPAEPGELPTELGCRGRQRARRPRRAIQLYAFARINLCLPVPRKMVAVLRHQHMRQQSRSRHAARDRTGRRFRLHDFVAARASELRTHRADHFETCRNPFQNLRNIFAQRLHLATAVRTSRFLRQDLPHLARQVRRQRLTHGPSVIRSARRSPRRWRSIRLCCLRRFQFVQPQLQLL